MDKELGAVFEDFPAEEEAAQSDVHPAHSEARGRESTDVDPVPSTGRESGKGSLEHTTESFEAGLAGEEVG